MASARETAMKVIYDIEFNGAYSNMAVKNALDNSCFSKQDRALITNLVYGVTDKKLTLDYVVRAYSKLRLKKISKYILTILRMGIYQLLFMDKIPQSAAVNESVKLAKRYGHGASAGYVNGILRAVAKEGIQYPSDRTEYLSVKYSFPRFLCERWTNEFGYDFTEEMLASFLKEAPLILRPNTLKTTADELSAKLLEKGVQNRLKEDYIIAEGFEISSCELYKAGLYTVQDAAAIQASKILNPLAGDTVIDMCAAPGGKTTHMAEIMKNEGKIYAFDVHEHKIDLIKKNAKRLGVTIIEASVSDGCVPNEKYAGAADKVMCDVPCSGLGIIRRKPDIKWNREENNNLPEIQQKILRNAAWYLKTGGEIVYSTCTIEREENEGVTSAFIENNSCFEKVYEKTFYPHIDDTDGFYICKMKRIR